MGISTLLRFTHHRLPCWNDDIDNIASVGLSNVVKDQDIRETVPKTMSTREHEFNSVSVTFAKYALTMTMNDSVVSDVSSVLSLTVMGS